MNVVALIGNVSTNPELTYTAGDRAVCKFRIAISRPGGELADFFDVVCFERQAEVCNEYLQLGRRVGIEGRMHNTSSAASFEIVAHRVSLLGRDRVASENAEVTA